MNSIKKQIYRKLGVVEISKIGRLLDILQVEKKSARSEEARSLANALFLYVVEMVNSK